MVHKYVDESLQPKPELAVTDYRFDTITKLEGSLNAKVLEK
jgi:predicted transcriptional regulator